MLSFDLTVIVVALLALLVMTVIIAVMRRIRTCASDKILVKYGQIGGELSARAVHGGTTFVWPVVQGYRYLDLTPMTVDIDLRRALSKQNIRVNVPSRFTFGIGTTHELMNNAAERLLSLDTHQVEDTAKDIIYGQLRATIAMMDIEEINGDREKFESRVLENIESELMKIGLRLINVNISDITDESGYIEALGQRAAAEAINKARVQVAEQEREGAVGSAQAEQEQRIRISDANAKAVTGENQARALEAASLADLREAQAEAQRRGDAAEAVKAAAAASPNSKPKLLGPSVTGHGSTPTLSYPPRLNGIGYVPRPRAKSRRRYWRARPQVTPCKPSWPVKRWAGWRSSPRWRTVSARSWMPPVAIRTRRPAS